jgi:hypothetical protein
MLSSRKATFRSLLGLGRRRFLSSGTYYDSQSGLHIPVHNEQEIRVFLNVSHARGEKEPFVPHQLYKRSDEAFEVEDKLQYLSNRGVHGLILPRLQFPRDARNLAALSSIAPPNFFLLFSQEESAPRSSTEMKDNTSAVLSLGEHEDLQSKLHGYVQNSIHTTLAVSESDFMGDIEAITLANNIATMIDSVGGCDFIWLSSKSDVSADKAVEVCEELVYLDVAGPTIKSRLLIESLNEDVLEDSMFAGVNKFVVDEENDVEAIEEVASAQGKSIVMG